MKNEHIKHTYGLLRHTRETEMRIKPANGKMFKVFIRCEKDLLDKARQWDGKGQIYVGLNERHPGGSLEKDVRTLGLIVIDLDPERERNTSSTDEQLQDAENVSLQALDWFEKQGWGKPHRGMSGNGYQLWCPVPLTAVTDENREELTEKKKLFEQEVRKKFQTKTIKVDSVHDLPRIMKLIGVTSIKGELHRVSHWIDPEQPIKEMTRLWEHIQALKPDNVSKHENTRESPKDTSRSGAEWGECCKAIKKYYRKGLRGQDLETEVYSYMTRFAKWSQGTNAYRKITYEKSLKKIEEQQTKKAGISLQADPKQATFQYDTIQPEQDVNSLATLEPIITKNFDRLWFETRACLSVLASLSLKDLSGCPSLNLIGPPSGEKTTVLSFFYNNPLVYLSDDFTPRSFVSHSSNVKKEELEQVDLLPKLRNKCLISPELAPLFEAPKDKLVDNFAMLTRVLDGEGLNRDSGVHGHRGYSGEYKFAWLGASTPLRASVWQIMGKIGNRLFFLNMREKNRTDRDYASMFLGKAYSHKIKECRGAVDSFLKGHFERYPLRSVEWDPTNDYIHLETIIKHAKFMAKLRGSLMTWKSRGDQGSYEYDFPIVEEPPRAIGALYTLAKGHALLNGRTFLRTEDLEIVQAVCWSTMPHDRHKLLSLLAEHEGRLNSKQIEEELGCSADTAYRTMRKFEALGLVKVKSLEGVNNGRPLQYVEIMPEFEQVLTQGRFYAEKVSATQGENNAENPFPQKNNPVRDAYSCVNAENFLKNANFKGGAQGENNAEKGFPQEITPVCDAIVQLLSKHKEAFADEIIAELPKKQQFLADAALDRLRRDGVVYEPRVGKLALFVQPEALG